MNFLRSFVCAQYSLICYLYSNVCYQFSSLDISKYNLDQPWVSPHPAISASMFKERDFTNDHQMFILNCKNMEFKTGWPFD